MYLLLFSHPVLQFPQRQEGAPQGARERWEGNPWCVQTKQRGAGITKEKQAEAIYCQQSYHTTNILTE